MTIEQFLAEYVKFKRRLRIALVLVFYTGSLFVSYRYGFRQGMAFALSVIEQALSGVDQGSSAIPEGQGEPGTFGPSTHSNVRILG